MAEAFIDEKDTALQEKHEDARAEIKGWKAKKDALVKEINAGSLVTKYKVLTELLLVPEFWGFFQTRNFAVQGCESLSKVLVFRGSEIELGLVPSGPDSSSLNTSLLDTSRLNSITVPMLILPRMMENLIFKSENVFIL